LSLLIKIWQKRVVKFALIGAIGVPINLVALAFFLAVLKFAGLQGDLLEAVATVCAFEVGTILNFVLNQLITYNDQVPTTLSAWIVKSIKAQFANISAFLIATLLSIFFSVVLQLNPFISNTLGIITNFVYKFLISDRFVFRVKPVRAVEEAATVSTIEDVASRK
jgi:putative flippase GtrA